MEETCFVEEMFPAFALLVSGWKQKISSSLSAEKTESQSLVEILEGISCIFHITTRYQKNKPERSLLRSLRDALGVKPLRATGQIQSKFWATEKLQEVDGAEKTLLGTPYKSFCLPKHLFFFKVRSFK